MPAGLFIFFLSFYIYFHWMKSKSVQRSLLSNPRSIILTSTTKNLFKFFLDENALDLDCLPSSTKTSIVWNKRHIISLYFHRAIRPLPPGCSSTARNV